MILILIGSFIRPWWLLDCCSSLEFGCWHWIIVGVSALCLELCWHEVVRLLLVFFFGFGLVQLSFVLLSSTLSLVWKLRTYLRHCLWLESYRLNCVKSFIRLVFKLRLLHHWFHDVSLHCFQTIVVVLLFQIFLKGGLALSPTYSGLHIHAYIYQYVCMHILLGMYRVWVVLSVALCLHAFMIFADWLLLLI